MAVFNGTKTIITIGGSQIAELTDTTLTTSRDLFEVTSKDSAGNKEVLPGLKEWEVSGEGRLDFLATTGYNALFTAQQDGTPLTVVVTNAVTGDKKFTGTAYVSDLEQNAPMEDVVTFSFTLTGTGALVMATI